MLDRAKLKHLYFLGIAGTGMGTVAAMFREIGLQITGSDQAVYPPMSDFLRDRGIIFHEGYKEQNLSPKPDLAVVGNVVSRGNPELEAILTHRIPFVSLPELLRGWFLYRSRNLVVTGTHGKTTTSTMLAFLLEKGGLQPSWFIGGVPVDLPGGCHHGKGPFWVLEGDEYDTSFADKRSKFLHYLPELVILNNVEFDHADIYPDLAAIQKSFRQLLNVVPKNGLALINADDPHAVEVAKDAPCEILEVGAGDGVLLTAIRDKRSDIRLIAIDIVFSSTTIERLADSRIEMLETPIDALASAENIDVGVVDVVVMNQSIEHLWKPDVVLSCLARVLSKDGRMAVSTPDFDGYDRKLWNKYWGGWYAPRHLNLFTQSAIERLALNCGLIVTHKKHLVAPVIWCHSVGGYLKSRFPNGRLPKRLLESPIVALLLFAVVDLLAKSLRLRTSNVEYILQKH
ncbi:MAG: methyltransferase domain-containing protein [Bacteroidetes bacterium]|nr:methyltransferase domain-containing protein [Bacteroidota bacterium]